MTVVELGQGPVREAINIPNHAPNWIPNHTPIWFTRNFLKQRASVISVLDGIPGNHLVLVHYPQGHVVDKEWVFNGYDIPSQRIIWAHDLDPSDPDKPLICHYRNRHIWLVEPVDTEVWSPALTQKALQAVNTSQMCADSGEANEEHTPVPGSAGAAIGVN
jgi:hypothetical protein